MQVEEIIRKTRIAIGQFQPGPEGRGFCVQSDYAAAFCLTDFRLDIRVAKFKVLGPGKSNQIRGDGFTFDRQFQPDHQVTDTVLFDILAQTQRVYPAAAMFDLYFFFPFGNGITFDIGDGPG